ncbi:MAG: ABC transporter permease subunit, partial [Gammaproteobacteria bacterium]
MSIHDFWTPFSLYPFLNALFIGVSLASIFFIAALGLTIIYGAMGVINMAHGEFIMLGAYTTYVFQQFLGVP